MTQTQENFGRSGKPRKCDYCSDDYHDHYEHIKGCQVFQALVQKKKKALEEKKVNHLFLLPRNWI